MMSDKFNPNQGQTRKTPSLPLTRLGGNAKPAHAAVYLLADHLDAVLAACEDIVTAHLTWNRGRRAGDVELTNDSIEIRDAIEHIRKLENLVIMRVLKSRERAEEVARVDKRFRQLAKLYTAGTAVLVDAVEECSDSTEIDFATADTVTAYMRSRGLVDPEAPAPAIGEDVPVGEEFLIARRIAAGPLMDLSATLLDALELHYDLFLDDNEMALPPQVNRFEEAPQSEAGSDADPLADAISQVREDAAADHPDDNPEIWARLAAGALAETVIEPAKDSDANTDSPDTEDDPWARELGLDADDRSLSKDDAHEPQAEEDGQLEQVEEANAAPDTADAAADADLDEPAELEADAQSLTETPARDDDANAEADAPEEAQVEADASADVDAPDPEAATDRDEGDTDDATSPDKDQPNIFEADTEIVMLSSRRAKKDADAETESSEDETQTNPVADATEGDDDASKLDAHTPAEIDRADGEDNSAADRDLIITAANDDDGEPEANTDAASDVETVAADSDDDSAAEPSSANDGETAKLTVANDDNVSQPEQSASGSDTDETDEAGKTKKPAPKSLLSRLRGLKK